MSAAYLNVLVGDCRKTLRTLPDESVQRCVTSPPYWGLRDYGHEDQLGTEASYQEYVANMVEVFRQVWRVLKKDGTLWLNLGDSYATGAVGQCPGGGEQGERWARGVAVNGRGEPQGSRGVSKKQPHNSNPIGPITQANRMPQTVLKPKDLVGIPWRVAFALQADGWWLRQDIIWSKPNPMPESVTDRCTKAHEYIFLLTKSAHYYYDAAAIAEPLAYGSIERLSQDVEGQLGSDRVPGKTNGNMKAVVTTPSTYKGSVPGRRDGPGQERRSANPRGYSQPYTSDSTKDYASGGAQDASATKSRIVDRILAGEIVTRNKRSVWNVTTKPFKGAHFATFLADLIQPCILAGSRAGDTVLDPFGGSGTTGQVAIELGRKAILCELNPEYVQLIQQRTNVTPGLSLDNPTLQPAAATAA